MAITTIFPSLFEGLLSEGIVARAIEKGLVKIDVLNVRDFTTDSYRTVDDYPYGGGPGMVMKAEPILKAVGSVTGIDYLKERGSPRFNAEGATEDATSEVDSPRFNAEGATGEVRACSSPVPKTKTARIVILSPQGRKYDEKLAKELSICELVVLICGRYKCIDERVRTILDAEEISIGDYVLSGGELPAMVIIESVVRLIPGAMEDEDSAAGDSFEEGILDCAYYTRPETLAGKSVPDILLSGNHESIRKWRRKNRLLRTLVRRADLLETVTLGEEDRRLMRECKKELESEE